MPSTSRGRRPRMSPPDRRIVRTWANPWAINGAPAMASLVGGSSPTQPSNPARNARLFTGMLESGVCGTASTRPQANVPLLSGIAQNCPGSRCALDFGSNGTSTPAIVAGAPATAVHDGTAAPGTEPDLGGHLMRSPSTGPRNAEGARML